MSSKREVVGGYAPEGKDTGVVKSKGTPRMPVLEGQEPLEHAARKPGWLKVRSPGGDNYRRLKKQIGRAHV